MVPKDTEEIMENINNVEDPILAQSVEKEVCWDKPFTLSGGCCQD